MGDYLNGRVIEEVEVFFEAEKLCQGKAVRLNENGDESEEKISRLDFPAPLIIFRARTRYYSQMLRQLC